MGAGGSKGAAAGGAAAGGAAAGGAAGGGGGGGRTVVSNANLNAFQRQFNSLPVDATAREKLDAFNATWVEIKKLLKELQSAEFTSMLLSVSPAMNEEQLKGIRGRIIVMAEGLKQHERAFAGKMRDLPDAQFKLAQEKVYPHMVKIRLEVIPSLNSARVQVDKLLKAKGVQLQEFAAQFPAVPTTAPGELTLEQRWAALKASPGGPPGGPPGSMGGGRRRSSRKTHKKAKRTSRKAHKKAHKGKKRNAVAA